MANEKFLNGTNSNYQFNSSAHFNKSTNRSTVHLKKTQKNGSRVAEVESIVAVFATISHLQILQNPRANFPILNFQNFWWKTEDWEWPTRHENGIFFFCMYSRLNFKNIYIFFNAIKRENKNIKWNLWWIFSKSTEQVLSHKIWLYLLIFPSTQSRGKKFFYIHPTNFQI